MSRVATVVLLLAALIAVTLGAYFIIFPRVQELHKNEARNGLVAAGRMLQEMDIADESRLLAKLSELARRPSLRDLLRSRPSEPQERQAWLNRLRAEVASLTTAARAVAPVKDFFILNEKGVGLVRNIDLHWTGKAATTDPELLEAINKASNGARQALVVQEGESLLRAVVVGVYLGGQVAAILCATFPLDDGIAKVRGGDIGQEVEFVYVTKTGVAAGAVSEESRKSLDKFVKDKGVQLTKLLDGQSLPPQEYLGVSGRLLVAGVPVSAYSGEGHLGILLARDVNAMQRPFVELTLWLFGLAAVCLVVLSIITVIFGGRLGRGLRQLELDALEISSGDEKRRFKVEGSAPVKSLAGLLNQMLMKMRGEEVEEERVSGGKEPFAGLVEAEAQEKAAEEREIEEEEDAEEEQEVEEERGVEEEDMMAGEAANEEPRLGVEEPPEPEEVEELEEKAEPEPAALESESETPGEPEREIADWEKFLEEETGPPLGKVPEESTAEVSLEQNAKEMEAERRREEAEAALREAVVDHGEEDEDEDDEDVEPPTRVADLQDLHILRQQAAVPDEPPAAPQQPAEAQKPESEEDRYYREMYEEFVRAKQKVGEKVEKLNLARFVRKLKKQEEMLKAKHGCKGVRFQVTVRNNQVSLRPRIIR